MITLKHRKNGPTRRSIVLELFDSKGKRGMYSIHFGAQKNKKPRFQRLFSRSALVSLVLLRAMRCTYVIIRGSRDRYVPFQSIHIISNKPSAVSITDAPFLPVLLTTSCRPELRDIIDFNVQHVLVVLDGFIRNPKLLLPISKQAQEPGPSISSSRLKSASVLTLPILLASPLVLSMLEIRKYLHRPKDGESG